MPDLSKLYRFRFREADRAGKMRIWKVLCERFFQPVIGEDRVIVDLACGYGEFINNIPAGKKVAVDLNLSMWSSPRTSSSICAARRSATGCWPRCGGCSAPAGGS